MNRIFISYRREDSEGFARSLYQSLAEEFGKGTVFMDVEEIEPGIDFIEAIDKNLETCGACLVFIGKEWAACTDDSGKRRLENPDDFVRIEIARAIKRNIRVIPILIKEAKMPNADELPDDLQPLIRRQALELRHDQWKYDVEHLINVLGKCLNLHSVKKGPKDSSDPIRKQETSVTPPKSKKKVNLMAATITIAIIFSIIAGTAIYLNQKQSHKYDLDDILILPDPSHNKAKSGKSQDVQRDVAESPMELFTKKQGIPPTPKVPSTINLSGVWRDTDGIGYTISQSGNMFYVKAFDPVMGVLIFNATGTISGNEFKYTYQSIESQGFGQGTVSSDNRIIYFTSIDNYTGIRESGQLYR